MGQIDFNSVGDATNLKPPAARMRYTRLRRAIEGGTLIGTHGTPFQAGTETVDGSPKKRKKVMSVTKTCEVDDFDSLGTCSNIQLGRTDSVKNGSSNKNTADGVRAANDMSREKKCAKSSQTPGSAVKHEQDGCRIPSLGTSTSCSAEATSGPALAHWEFLGESTRTKHMPSFPEIRCTNSSSPDSHKSARAAAAAVVEKDGPAVTNPEANCIKMLCKDERLEDGAGSTQATWLEREA